MNPAAHRPRLSTVALALAAGAWIMAFAAAGSAEPQLIALPDDVIADDAAGFDSGVFSDDRFADSRRRPDSRDLADPGHWVVPLRPNRISDMQDGPIWRFTGEHHIEEFLLYVADPGVSEVLHLTSRSTVNVLPERSVLRIRVNDTELDQVTLDNFTDFETAKLVLPAGALQRGRNRVQIEVLQHHRIFCGPDASWALWTDIDLARSGLPVESSALSPGPDSFLMALGADSGGPAGVEIRGASALGALREPWLRLIATRLGSVMSGQPLSFRFTDYWTVARATPLRARVTFLPAAENRVSFRVGADGAQVMLIEFVPGSEIPALADLDDILTAPPQSARPPLIDINREVALEEFGVQTERFAQRFARRDYAFRLPDDWLILTAEKARLRLDYIYAEGLPQGSVLVLFMNGEPIRMLPLWGDPNRYITRFPIDFEARLLNAGANLFSFELLIPGDPPDMPCSASRGAVLEIAGSSTLHVPFSPSMFMPDMGLAFTALAPESLVVNDLTHRAFDEFERIALSAALARAPAGYRPGLLHLMSLDDLGSIPLGRYAVERRLLEDVLLSHTVGAGDANDAPGHEGWSGSGPDPFRFVQEAPGYRAALGKWSEWFLGHAGDFVQWVNPRTQNRLNDWLSRQTGTAIFLQLDDSRPDQIWMLRSPDAEINAIASAIIAARTLGEGPRGQVSVLDADGVWRNWHAPDRRPIMLEPWTLSNFRTAMGNVVSARPITFVIILFFMVLISAALALRLILSTREQE